MPRIADALCLMLMGLVVCYASGVSAQMLTIEVNTPTGRVLLINDSGVAVDFDFYEIRSDLASLNPGGWASLEDQGVGDNGVPDDGIGWEEQGIPEEILFAEAFLFGSTMLDDGGRFNLGFAFKSASDEDLVFNFQTPLGAEIEGLIVYDPTVLGDMDGNGVFDAFDVDDFELALADPVAYSVARPGLDADALGDINGDGLLDAFDVGDFESLLAGGGAAAGLESSAPTLDRVMSVPEPGVAGMLTFLGMGAMLRRR